MKSVVVCGSKKYKDEIAAFCRELEQLGVLVFEPDFREVVSEREIYHSAYLTEKMFKGFTLEHFGWIRKAEGCYVYNQDEYVGVSVSMEMAYATAHDKPVFALNAKTGDPCRDALIDKVVKTPTELAALL